MTGSSGTYRCRNSISQAIGHPFAERVVQPAESIKKKSKE